MSRQVPTNRDERVTPIAPQPATGHGDVVAAPQSHVAPLSQRTGGDPSVLTPCDVLHLQRTVGNQAVCRLLPDTVQHQEHATQRKVESEGETAVLDAVVEEFGKNSSMQRQNVPKPHPVVAGSVQRYTEEQIETSAYYEWEKAGKEPHVSVEQMRALWDKGIQGLIAHHIWKHKEGGGEAQTKEKAEQDFVAAGDIWEKAKGQGLPIDWITESYIKAAFEDETVDEGKSYAIKWIDETLLPIHRHLERQRDTNAIKIVKQYLLSQDFDPDLIEKRFLESTITQSTAYPGGGVTIDRVHFMAANPVIIRKNPVIEISEQYAPAIGKATFTSISRSGSFAMLAPIQISFHDEMDLSDWEVGIIQNVKSDRQALYTNGLKYHQTFDWMMDAIKPPWIKDNNQSLEGKTSGQTVQIFMSDSPNWAAPNIVKKSPIMRFEINDEFRAFVVVKNGSGQYFPLFKQEWKFSSDGKTVTYQSTGQQRLAGASGELITANSPKAYDQKDVLE